MVVGPAAESQTGGEPPTGQPVDRRELFGEQDGVAPVPDVEDSREQLDSSRPSRGRESDQRLHVVVDQTVDDAERGGPHRFGVGRPLAELARVTNRGWPPVARCRSSWLVTSEELGPVLGHRPLWVVGHFPAETDRISNERVVTAPHGGLRFLDDLPAGVDHGRTTSRTSASLATLCASVKG